MTVRQNEISATGYYLSKRLDERFRTNQELVAGGNYQVFQSDVDGSSWKFERPNSGTSRIFRLPQELYSISLETKRVGEAVIIRSGAEGQWSGEQLWLDCFRDSGLQIHKQDFENIESMGASYTEPYSFIDLGKQFALGDLDEASVKELTLKTVIAMGKVVTVAPSD